jgi:hypothetical protein
MLCAFKKWMVAAVGFLFIASVASAQYKKDWRDDIDRIIQQADSLSLKSQRTFSLLKPYHPEKDIRETWFYTTRDGKVIIFEIQYVIDSLEFSEIYYMHNGDLICMEQYEAPYLSVYADQLKRGESFFFLDNSLKQYVMTGRHRPSQGLWDSETNSMTKFNQRFAELKRHMTYLK